MSRLVYFLRHPSEYAALWGLDLTLATVALSLATLWIVIRQLRLMRSQMTLMERQTAIMAAQDELNRALLARRAKLRMYAVSSPSSVSVCCENIGDKTARGFFWHLAIPVPMPKHQVWDGSGNRVLDSQGAVIRDGVQCTHYLGYANDPLFPSRTVRLAQFSTTDPTGPLWWKTVSEDGVEPTGEGSMNLIERRESGVPATDA